MERYLKALAGPNPREEGVDPAHLTQGLKSRIRVWTRVIAISAAIGFAIVFAYVSLVGVPA